MRTIAWALQVYMRALLKGIVLLEGVSVVAEDLGFHLQTRSVQLSNQAKRLRDQAIGTLDARDTLLRVQ